jgi:hypothetical protein
MTYAYLSTIIIDINLYISVLDVRTSINYLLDIMPKI